MKSQVLVYTKTYILRFLTTLYLIPKTGNNTDVLQQENGCASCNTSIPLNTTQKQKAILIYLQCYLVQNPYFSPIYRGGLLKRDVRKSIQNITFRMLSFLLYEAEHDTLLRSLCNALYHRLR